MKTNDYVKYMTETFVRYIDQPKEERKKLRLEKKEDKEVRLIRWFGLFSYLFLKRMNKKK